MAKVLVVVLLLLGNAFFVAGEFALIAARRTVVEPMTGSSKRARLALRAMEQLPLMIAGAQLGVTVCSLGLGAIAEPAFAHVLTEVLTVLRLPTSFADPIGFVLALIVVVFAHTVLGEMVPKNLTLVGPEQAVLWLWPPMLWFCTGTRPVLVFMRWGSRQGLRVWRIEGADAGETGYTGGGRAGVGAQGRTQGLLD